MPAAADAAAPHDAFLGQLVAGFEGAAIALAVTDACLTLVAANAPFARHFGLDTRRPAGANLLEELYAAGYVERPCTASDLLAAREISGVTRHAEVVRLVKLTFARLGNGGEPTRILVTLADLSGAPDDLDHVLRERRLLRALVTRHDQAEIVLDDKGLVRHWSPAAQRLLGWREAEVIERRIIELGLMRPGDHEALFGALADPAGAVGARLIPSVHRDGTTIPLTWQVARLKLADRSSPFLVAALAPPRHALRAARSSAGLDGLTGVRMRHDLVAELGQALAASAEAGVKLGLVHIDLADFKAINESLGHGAADQVLQAVARILAIVAPSGSRVYRYGGDEFIVVLAAVEALAAIEALAESVMSELGGPITVGGMEVRLTATLGAAIYPTDADSPQLLLERASRALYEGRADGATGLVLYSSRVAESAERRSEVRRALHRALRSEAFGILYQPRVRLSDALIVGAEALLRFHADPSRPVQTRECITVAERSHQIVELGRLVLRKVCRQARQWQDEGLRFGRIAVHLATTQLAHPEFRRDLEEILRSSDCLPQSLEIELSGQLHNPDFVILGETVAWLRALGIRVLLDDFGMSRMAPFRLLDLKVDGLTLDHALTHRLTERTSVAIAGSLVALGQSLNLDVVAHGVETSGQLHLVRMLGCTHAQGYLWSPPIPAADYAVLLST